MNPDEIRHGVQTTQAQVAMLSQRPELYGTEDVARALADLEVDLARVAAVVDRAQPAQATDAMLRLDIAELKDALPHVAPALERPIQSVLASAAYLERRLKRFDLERAAALRQSALRRARVRVLLGVAVAATPFALQSARKKPLITSALVLAGCALAASALLVRTVE